MDTLKTIADQDADDNCNDCDHEGCCKEVCQGGNEDQCDCLTCNPFANY